MLLSLKRSLAAALSAALILAAVPAFAENGEGKPGDQKPPAADPAKEFAEAAAALKDAAGKPECVWLGRRVVGLLYRDDMDTAFRHLEMYDRFGCPGGHIQASFRCLVLQGNINTKEAETLNGRVHACWINPANPAPPPTAAAAAATGTSSR